MTVTRDPVTGTGQKVTSQGQAVVRAITETDIENASNEGLAFSWSSTYSATGGQEIISLQNDDAGRHLHISRIQISTDTASLFTLLEVTSGTPGGTGITAQNLNLDSGKAAEETAFGNASVTGSLTGNILELLRVGADGIGLMDLQSSLILAKNDIVAITMATTGVPAVTIFGHYETLSEV